MTAGADEKFVSDYTIVAKAVLVPDIRLRLATDLTPLWLATEDFLKEHNMAPPYWAFAWPGAEALAWYITQNPELVAGRRVLDFAAGGGLAAIACARAGAITDAAEIDRFAIAAMSLNAHLNSCKINILHGDLVGNSCRWDVILAGDVCYEAPMAARILPWLRACAATATVIIADPGRAYVPRDRFSVLARITVPTSKLLEDSHTKMVSLLAMQP